MKTKILRVLCLLLVISMVAFPVNAAESNEPEFRLQGAEVTLYDEDVTVEIPFITPKSYGIEGQFSTTATGDANTIKLTGINTAFAPVANEDLVDVTTGTVMWVNNDFNGPKEDELVTGVYTIPADTAEGEYTVSFELRVFTGEDYESGEDYEPIEPNEPYTATIKVKKHVCSDVTTDNDHLCDDPACEKTVDGHSGEIAYKNITDTTHDEWNKCCDTLIKENVEHTYVDGFCACGAEEPVTDITVVYKGAALANAFTVEGNVVTVTYSMACKVGYWDATAGKYVALTATKVSDNCYSFTAPEGVTEVLLVVKGDVTGDGVLKNGDKNRLNAFLLDKTTLTAEAEFAADVTGDGELKNGDKNRLNAFLLEKTTLAW